MPMLLEALFIEIVGAILYDAGRRGLGKVFTETPARKAIETTAADFPEIPSVNASLTKWCKSEDFLSQLETLQAGYDPRPDERLINSFINEGLFYDGINNTHNSAARVLVAFFKRFEEELSSTDLWPIIQEQRTKLRDRAIHARLNDVCHQIDHLPASFEATVHKVVSQYIPPFDPINNPAVQEKIHFANIDLAVELLKEGKAKTARKKLEDLRTRISSENTSIDLRFRLVANLASCALQLDDYETARMEYDSALRLKPEHHLVLSYAALTAVLTGDLSRALEYARRSRPEDERDPQITSSYLRVLHHSNLDNEIEELLRKEEWIQRDPKCALALGLIKLSQQNYGQAEAYFKSALNDESENPHVHRLIAQTILLPIDQLLKTDPPLQLSEHILERSKNAESHLTEAIGIFEKWENPSGLHEALLQRAYVRGLQGHDYAALADCDRLLTTYPNDAMALYQKGHTLLFAGKPDEALQCFSRIESADERPPSMLSIALAYHRAQLPNKVIEVLAGNWHPTERTRQQITVADLLLNAYHQVGDTEHVEALLHDLQRERADDSDALAVIARLYMRSGQREEALARYKHALDCAAPGNQQLRISDELADYYYEVADWAAAAELYKKTVDQSRDNLQTRKYLTSLYNSGARRAALHLAETLRGGGDAIPYVSEIEARVLVAAGELEEALPLFQQLARIEPQKISHKLYVIEVQHLLKNLEDARESLNQISFDEVKNDSTALLQIAHLRQQLDLGGDLPFAYRARRIAFNDADIHHAYVQLFMQHTRRESGDLDVTSIDVDYAVHVKDAKGHEKTYLIVQQEEYDLQQGEIAPTDARAVEMLGKRTGDMVVFNKGKIDEVEYEITNIQHKYVYAFQQTLTRHTEWFGGSDTMMVLDVADGDFSKFFRMIDLQHERQRKIAELYHERRLPLSTIARLKGANLFDTWASLVHTNDMRMHMTTGNLAELQRSLEVINVNDAIVVDMSALFTLCYIGSLDKLPKVFKRLVIAKPVADKLESWLDQMDRESPHMIVGKREEQYIRQEVTEEMITHRKNFVSTIKSFVENHTEILPSLRALDVPTDQLDQYNDVLGVSAASLFVASELKLPLYMDDVGLSQIAAGSEWQVQGVSTLAVLAKMKSRGLVSAIEHCQALKTLILGNYIVVNVNAQQLWWMCQSEGKKSTPRMKRILRLMLHGPEWDEAAALLVGAQFTFKMWLEVIDPDEKLEFLDSVIEALISGREVERVKTLFKAEFDGLCLS